ncbi:dihydrofolate reductase [Allosphingosinicella vermicomposti]|uniref:dihydrofolate reductase n=1 Tax=Allosphingosinicella vermicomposti TaxID=614671 RepID=UPI00131A4D42|nr:dihydrofolate reductase [Allosphingosinicella vermicomposti]
MKRLTSIVAVNREGVIGCGNTLPWRLKTDLRFFKEQTLSNVILMGRRTFDSLGKKCLPGRCNVVISHSFNLFPETEECKAAYGIEDGLFRASLAPRRYKETFVIGGASMYEQFAPYVDRYLITMVEKGVPNGDTFFDQGLLGNPDNWTLEKIGSAPQSSDDEAAFTIFEISSRTPDDFLKRRMAAIENARAASMTQRSSKSRSSAGTQPLIHALQPNYSML